MTTARILLSLACWWGVLFLVLGSVAAWRRVLTSTRRDALLHHEAVSAWLLPPLALLCAAGAVAVWP